MAIMFTMSVYHPDILEFIDAKTEEGKLSNSNISVVVDNKFMELVEGNKPYWTEFNGKQYHEYNSGEVFDKIVEGAWRNGEPGLIFFDAMNDSPYRHLGIKIEATNPCGEQPLPPFGSCNLASLDLSKFLTKANHFDWQLFEIAIRKSIRFLDSVIDVNSFPTKKIEAVSKASRQLGLGIMGLADLYLKKEIPYGSDVALELLDSICEFMHKVSTDESEIMGNELGIPEWCKKLPEPRRNITLLTIAPTGSISIISGCNSGIEPFFSEITRREDKTGVYIFDSMENGQDYFRCAVPMDGDKSREVTWEEHVMTQSVAQKWIDSGVSKTINFPTMTRRDTIGKAFKMAWEKGCKGITVYRNGSRDVEVLTPKNVSLNRCPACNSPTMKYDGCTKCTDCEWEMCTVG